MPVLQHSKLAGIDNHAPYSFPYNTEADRLSAVGFSAEDVGKLAWQKSDNTLWMLTNHSPVEWSSFGSGGGSSPTAAIGNWILVDTVKWENEPLVAKSVDVDPTTTQFKIVSKIKAASENQVNIRFNDDAGNNYRYSNLYSYQSDNPRSSTGTSTSFFGAYTYNNNGGSSEVIIHNTPNQGKTCLGNADYYFSSGYANYKVTADWLNEVDVISKINFFPNITNGNVDCEMKVYAWQDITPQQVEAFENLTPQVNDTGSIGNWILHDSFEFHDEPLGTLSVALQGDQYDRVKIVCNLRKTSGGYGGVALTLNNDTASNYRQIALGYGSTVDSSISNKSSINGISFSNVTQSVFELYPKSGRDRLCFFSGGRWGASEHVYLKSVKWGNNTDEITSINIYDFADATNNTGEIKVYVWQDITETDLHGRLLDTKYFSQVGTHQYTPTPGTRMIEVEVQAGGGGSGGTPTCPAGKHAFSSGGAGGGYAKKQILINDLQLPETIIVGNGGSAGVLGKSTGGNGGNSSFGSLVSATGGQGSTGTDAITSGLVPGTSPGVGVNGDFMVPGEPGDTAWVDFGWGEIFHRLKGGGSYLGTMTVAHNDNQSYGGGAGGIRNYENRPACAGFSGGQGIVIIKEYS